MLEFGPFQIDSVRRLLYRHETVVDIPPKAFAVLLTLVEKRGQVISKDELMKCVWGETVVEENNLARSISTLRKALGEKSGEHRYVITVPGRGYSFVAGEESAEAADESPSKVKCGVRFPTFRALKGVTIMAAVGIAAHLWISGQARPVNRFEPVRLRNILTNQRYPSAALSPDGKYMAYAGGKPGHPTVCLRLIESGKEVELLTGHNHSYGGLTFTQDGQRIFLVEESGPGTTNILLELPVSGGSAREVARELDSPPSVSPDGSRVAFVRETQEGESVLLLRDIANNKEDRLTAKKSPTFLDYPVWSPDGQSIAYSEIRPDGAFLQEIAIEKRRQRQIGERWGYIKRFAWLPRGDGFLLSATAPGTDDFTIWRVVRSDGSARRITENVDSLQSVAISADGTRAMTVAERSLAAVWIGTPGAQTIWRQLLPAADNVAAASWTSDGNILVERRAAANGRSIHIVNPDGKEQAEILPPGPYRQVRLCSDRRKLVYYSAHPMRAGLWVTDLTMGRASQLIALGAETVATCLPNDHLVSFASKDQRWWPGLWNISIEGGEPERISQQVEIRYAISTDGRYAAYFDQEGAVSPQRKAAHVAVVSLDGRGLAKTFSVPPTVARNVPLKWMPGEPVVTYVDERGGVDEIWGQRVADGEPWQITSLSGGLITGFDWSPDGKQLVVSRGMRSYELLLLELHR